MPSLSLFKRQLLSLKRGNISPVFFLVLIEAPKKDHISVEMAKFGQTSLTGLSIEDSSIVLSNNIHSPLCRQVDVPPTGVARIREQFC